MILYEVSMCTIEDLPEEEILVSRVTMAMDNISRLYRGVGISSMLFMLLLEGSGSAKVGEPDDIPPVILRSSGDGVIIRI